MTNTYHGRRHLNHGRTYCMKTAIFQIERIQQNTRALGKNIQVKPSPKIIFEKRKELNTVPTASPVAPLVCVCVCTSGVCVSALVETADSWVESCRRTVVPAAK